jgi:acetyl esterase/lipase
LIVAIVICIVGSPDLSDTIFEYLSKFEEPKDLTIIRDVSYVSPPDTRRAGDLYLPKNGPILRPAVIIVHGGSWSKGDKQDVPETVIARYFGHLGFVCFSINYRLLGNGGEFPNDIIDLKEALAFLVANREKWHIDSGRLATIGSSSGATATMIAAYAPNAGVLANANYGREHVRVAAVATFSAPSDFSTLPSNPYVKEYLQSCRAASEQEKYKIISPITYAAGAVPTIMVHGTVDKNVPYSQAVKMAQSLRENHVPAELIAVDGASHFIGARSQKIALGKIYNFFVREKMVP